MAKVNKKINQRKLRSTRSLKALSNTTINNPLAVNNFTTASLLMAIIIIVSIAVYFNALFNGFVSDDIGQVVKNPWITDFKFLTKIFTSEQGISLGANVNYYRPLGNVINMCSFHLFGLKPWGFHLVNVLFHAGNSMLVFMIALPLLRENYLSMSGPISTLSDTLSSRPFIAALLFATLPIHTEAVTWVSGLFDVSFTFFYLLALWLYIRYKEGFRIGYPLSLVSFFAATLCKEPALTLPLILIGYDYAFRTKEDSILAAVKRYVPYFIIAGIYFMLRHNALKAPITTEYDETYHALSLYQYVINVFPLFTAYLRDLIFPFHLNFWHTFNLIESLFNLRVMLSMAVTVAYILVVFLAWRRNKVIFFCLLFIIVPLLPTFYIKAIAGKPYAERYLYLPSFGFVVLLAMSLDFLKKKMPRYNIVITLITLSVVGLYCTQTITRNSVWKDELTLYTDTVNKNPEPGRPHRLLGEVLMSMGRVYDAIDEYQKALPSDVIAHQELGSAYINLGRPEQGKKQYQQIIATLEAMVRMQPNNALYRNNLGNAYCKTGAYNKGIEQLQVAVRLAPSEPLYRQNLDNAIALRNSAGKPTTK